MTSTDVRAGADRTHRLFLFLSLTRATRYATLVRQVSVSVLKEGDEVYLLEHGEAARHTGIAIKESIHEY